MGKGKVRTEDINAQPILSNVYRADTDVVLVCVSDAWLQKHTSDSHVSIPNYVLYRNDVSGERVQD